MPSNLPGSKLLLMLLVLIWSARALGQDMFCAVTNPSGSITILWSDAGYLNTNRYELLWASTSNGFNTADSVAINSSGIPDYSFTINTVNGNTARYYFKLNIVSNTGSVRTEFFSSIFLDVSYAVPGNLGMARLSWNPVSSAYSGDFVVQRFELGVWNNLSTIPVSSPVGTQLYDDTLDYPFCDTSQVTYRISFHVPGSSCLSMSNQATKTLLDNTTPSDPVNDSVSIYYNPIFPGLSGCPVIGWSPSPGSDIAGYIIYRYSGSVFTTLDTIPSDSTIYIDKSVSGCIQSYTYALATIDKCGRTSPGTFATSPASIYLTGSQEIDPCTKKVDLSWNDYTHIAGGLAGYTVYRQVNTGPFIPINTLPAGTTEFVDSMNFINGSIYTYFIQAFNAAGTITSTTCQKRYIYRGPSSPDTIYIEQAGVVNDSYVGINGFYSPFASVSQLVLERAETGSNAFIPLDTISAPPGGFLPQKITFNDSSADFRSQSYTYRLNYVDSCKVYAIPPFRNTAQTIYLTCNLLSSSVNQLNWNNYEIWFQSVGSFDIYRFVNGTNDPPGILSSLPGNVFTYNDNLGSTDETAEICYRIVARENPGNPVADNAFSTSNLACVERDPLVFIPNAFAPYGKNNHFRPVVNFIIPDSFLMQIYNKWGQLIFETRSYFTGWDGTVNGVMSPADVYNYCIIYKSMSGKESIRRGLFTLVR